MGRNGMGGASFFFFLSLLLDVDAVALLGAA